MKEHKYRAWDIENNKMIKSYAHVSKAGQFYTAWTSNDSDREYIPMQYTGLKDKNGVEIYENDVIDYYGKNIIVKIPDIYIEVHKNLNPEWCEVIGNIYETPELLDKK